MSQMTLLSSSAGTFWGLTDGDEWTKLLLSNAINIRTTDRVSSGSPATVVSAYSDDGFINAVTVEDVASNLGGGVNISNTKATYFGFPLLEPDGEPVNLGSDQFTLDLFLEITENPGDSDNNKVFIGVGLNDGTNDFQTGRIGGVMIYKATTPQAGVFYGNGGQSVLNATNMRYVRTTVCTSAPGDDSPFQWVTSTVYGDNNERITTRQSQAAELFMSSSPARPTGSNAHVFITIGKQSANGDGAKQFKFKAYYKLDMHTFNGVASTRPG
tara:strand:+ start:103 stop:912 length:810 start_codon:yes stop_codon:yes gene_type:complete